MQRLRKSSALLIEIVIALGLLSILSLFLFNSFFQISAYGSLFDQASKREDLLTNAHQVLSRVFSQVEHEKKPATLKTSCFFTSPLPSLDCTQSLVFTYDNGVDRDPLYSNCVLARIFVDSNKCLCLMLWPSPSRWPDCGGSLFRKEILLDKVSSLHFTFYFPELTPQKVASEEIQTGREKKEIKGGEHTIWLKEYEEIPVIVKLKVLREEKEGRVHPVNFSYLLPSSSTIKIKETT